MSHTPEKWYVGYDQEVIGRFISRAEALRIARKILEQAERERLIFAEYEAARGIQWENHPRSMSFPIHPCVFARETSGRELVRLEDRIVDRLDEAISRGGEIPGARETGAEGGV